ncbi:saccharopine dehydrogenase-like oxidoreductase [Chroicocephalus ridibundus]|uniref:saccharopine dehydrogenase-like oxidoreductase n=1 Tax=Chroicocephalus ridibundus TaxID=1192867 RepID=UPI002FDD6824
MCPDANLCWLLRPGCGSSARGGWWWGRGPGRPYELVAFGASGFTGQFVVEEVARAEAGGELRGGLRWAVAGRSREKLRAVLERAAERLGKAALGAEVGLLLCDVGDAASLAAMARQTRLVLNCVGPLLCWLQQFILPVILRAKIRTKTTES